MTNCEIEHLEGKALQDKVILKKFFMVLVVLFEHKECSNIEVL